MNKIKNFIAKIAATVTAVILIAGITASVPSLVAKAAEKTTFQVDKEELAYWQQYCSDYYYRQIKDDYVRHVYDEFYSLAMYYLISDEDIELTNPDTRRDFWALSLTDITSDDYVRTRDSNKKYWDLEWDVYNILLLDNPIFFYLDDLDLGCTDDDDEYMFAFLTPDEIYANGKKRAAAREQIRKGLDTLYNEAVTNYDTLNEQVKFIDHRGIDKNGEIIKVPYGKIKREDGSTADQDIDSVFVYNSTVCTGYAKANQALFNRLGLDAVRAIRPNHSFVYVETNPGQWYSTEFSSKYLLEKPRSAYLKDSITCLGNVFKTDVPPMSKTRDYGAVSYLDRQVFTYEEADAMVNGVPGRTEEVPVNNAYSAYSTTVYRYYNPDNGEHLYTTSPGEAMVLTLFGWREEVSPGNSNADTSNSLNGVYQLYCATTGEHLYTTDLNECATLMASGAWINDGGEGPKFYSVPGGQKPMYRLYNPAAPIISSHHYTSDQNEINTLLRTGWSMDNGGKPIFCLN